MTTETKFAIGEYKTRDGRKARVYATDGGGDEPIHGAVFHEQSGSWETQSWDVDGFWVGADISQSGYDLMPPLREWWIVAGEAWDNEREAIDSTRLLQNAVKPIHVREVRDDQA